MEEIANTKNMMKRASGTMSLDMGKKSVYVVSLGRGRFGLIGMALGSQ